MKMVEVVSCHFRTIFTYMYRSHSEGKGKLDVTCGRYMHLAWMVGVAWEVFVHVGMFENFDLYQLTP